MTKGQRAANFKDVLGAIYGQETKFSLTKKVTKTSAQQRVAPTDSHTHLPWAIIKFLKKNQTDGQCILDPMGILIMESIVKT